ADGFPALHLENREVLDLVEQVPGLQQAVEQHILCGWLVTELLPKLLDRQREGLLPFGKEAVRSPDRAVGRRLPTSDEHKLDRLEQLGGAEVFELRANLLIPQDLSDSLLAPLVTQRGALALDDGDRDTVNEHGEVGTDSLL